MNRTFLVDIDETVLSYSDEFQFWMESLGYFSHHRLRDRYLVADTFDISHEETAELLVRFAETPAFGNLRVEADAKVVVTDLHRRGFRFVAISAAFPSTAAVRKLNLEAEFGFEWDVYCVGDGTQFCKQDRLRQFEPTYWVDDHADHAVTGVECGHTSFLIDRHHNRHLIDSRVHRVPDWFAIREIVLSMEDARKVA